VTNPLNLFRNGAVGFIDWLDASVKNMMVSALLSASAVPKSENDRSRLDFFGSLSLEQCQKGAPLGRTKLYTDFAREQNEIPTRLTEMRWRFRRTVKILPGLRLNLGKKGIPSRQS